MGSQCCGIRDPHAFPRPTGTSKVARLSATIAGRLKFEIDQYRMVAFDGAMRKYTADEVAEIIVVLRASGDYSPTEVFGMNKVAEVLRHFENLTDENIQRDVRRHFRSL
jgi:hypothetical protein